VKKQGGTLVLSIQESQGQILDSLKESPIQKECDALKQVILSNRKNTTYAVAYK